MSDDPVATFDHLAWLGRDGERLAARRRESERPVTPDLVSAVALLASRLGPGWKVRLVRWPVSSPIALELTDPSGELDYADLDSPFYRAVMTLAVAAAEGE